MFSIEKDRLDERNVINNKYLCEIYNKGMTHDLNIFFKLKRIMVKTYIH